MQVAFNFSETKAYSNLGVDPSLDVMITAIIADVVPAHRRHCRIQLGSVPAHHVPADDRQKFAQAICEYPPRWRGHISVPALHEAIVSNDLCAVVVDGLAPHDAAIIDDRWHTEKKLGYIGAFQLQHGDVYHEALYLMSLPARYHMYGTNLDYLIGPEAEYADGDYDSARFDELTEVLRSHGIETVKLRGTGATGTIFDPYETNIEFARTVGMVEQLLGSYLDGIVTEITLRARESDPRLLEIFHASLDALERNQNREFLAQAALSCRRFLERLADTVFPPRVTAAGQRKLGKEQYVNRLWQYVDEQLGPGGSDTAKKEIGSRIDFLNSVANKGLHSDVTIDEAHRLVLNLALLTRDLLRLTPPTGQPSLSYEAEQVTELMRMHSGIQ